MKNLPPFQIDFDQIYYCLDSNGYFYFKPLESEDYFNLEIRGDSYHINSKFDEPYCTHYFIVEKEVCRTASPLEVAVCNLLGYFNE